MIERPRHRRTLRRLLAENPVAALLGARQVGKTTLARLIAGASEQPVTFFDLESPRDVARLAEPELALEPLRGLVVLDEIQRRPELFPVLRVLADRPGRPATFLVLGSASPDLLRQSSESLAGRIAYHEVGGLGLDEVGPDELETLWLRGGFPRSFAAETLETSAEWRENFIRTFLERDLPQLGVHVPAPAMRRLWTMLAHYHGQTLNASELGRSLGVSYHTIRRHLDALEATFVVRIIQPWTENLKKRQVKSPRIFIEDSGLLHTLLGIESMDDLLGHPKLGASWEGFMMRVALDALQLGTRDVYGWSTHGGAEIDLFIPGPRRLGLEFKRTAAPSATRSIHTAMRDLKLDHVVVIYQGDDVFPLAEGITAVGSRTVMEQLPKLVAA